MAQLDDIAAREVSWYRDLVDGVGSARSLDKDLRDMLVELTRARATSEALWARQGGEDEEQAPPAAPTVDYVHLSRRSAMRNSDVRVTWEGLTPPSSRVTVLAPNGSEQIVSSGNSIAVTILVSGPITLRLNNQGRIMDVPAGDIECFELPAFSVPRGILPDVPHPTLPLVRIPPHATAAIQLPIARLSAGSTAGLQRQISDSAARAFGAALDVKQLLDQALGAGRASLDIVRIASESRPFRPTRPR